mgnify:CR=1 FL=1
MKILNKARRIKYLGFDDKWFFFLGVVILSFVMDWLFNNSFGRGWPIKNALIGWSISLFFSFMYWVVVREVLIRFRQIFPDLKDSIKRVIFFSIAFVSAILFVHFIGSQLLQQIIGINFNLKSGVQYILPIIFVSLMTMAVYEAIYFFLKLKNSTRIEEQSKQAIVQAQLDALRNQAQPHFFFNTMNTLRDIIDQNTKNEAMDFVDKISDVYRFILESGESNLIPLSDEIEFVKSYLHIQSERFGENLEVIWELDGSENQLLIVPISLQLLIENAIKHNVVSRSRPLRIKVNVANETISVSNPIQTKTTRITSTNLGLANIQKRYALITDRPVTISNGGIFKVEVPLLNQAAIPKHD